MSTYTPLTISIQDTFSLADIMYPMFCQKTFHRGSMTTWARHRMHTSVAPQYQRRPICISWLLWNCGYHFYASPHGLHIWCVVIHNIELHVLICFNSFPSLFHDASLTTSNFGYSLHLQHLSLLHLSHQQRTTQAHGTSRQTPTSRAALLPVSRDPSRITILQMTNLPTHPLLGSQKVVVYKVPSQVQIVFAYDGPPRRGTLMSPTTMDVGGLE